MDRNIIINITLGAFILLFGTVVAYLQSNNMLRSKVVEYITRAEVIYHGRTKSGGAKFRWVVNQLYDLLPTLLHYLYSQQRINTIVQNAFDSMQQYTKIQLDKMSNMNKEG